MKEIMLCAICNISSGNCSEDCAYCSQSGFVKTDIEKFRKKEIDKIVNEAKLAKANHALGFCLVTSGLGLDDEKLDFVCEAARAVNSSVNGLMLIACNGIATFSQLSELKKAGVFSYNHNLETSKEFFPNICTTHTWEQRWQTNIEAKRAGLELCCGGIYGLGESNSDRISFRKSLDELKPFSTPVNFFIGNEAFRIAPPPLSTSEALGLIKEHKDALPYSRVLIAGGREIILKERQYDVFDYGADAIVLGNYLTVKGEKANITTTELSKRGFKFATLCH